MFIGNALLVLINNLQFLSGTLLFAKLMLLVTSLTLLVNTINRAYLDITKLGKVLIIV
jgi:hypothetical protein